MPEVGTRVEPQVHTEAPDGTAVPDAEIPLLIWVTLGLPVYAVFAYLIVTLSTNRARRLELIGAIEAGEDEGLRLVEDPPEGPEEAG